MREGVGDQEALSRRGEARGSGAGDTAGFWFFFLGGGGPGFDVAGWLVGSFLLTGEILEFKCHGKEPVSRKFMMTEEREGIPGGVGP